jgi:hypothetical protein
MPAAAKQDPAAGSTPPGHSQTPPGQAKKQDAAQTTSATAPTATQQTTTVTRRAAKQQASTSTQTTTTTTTKTKQAQPAAAQPSTKQAKATGQAATSQAPTASPSRSPKKAAAQAAAQAAATPTSATATAASAPTQAAAPASQRTSGSFTAAKNRKHRAATSTNRSAASSAVTPVASISPAPVAASNPTTIATKTGKTGSGDGYTPRPTTPDDKPNVVFRTVRDAVEVIPSTIWILLGLLTGLAALFAVTSARQTRRAHRLAAERGTLLTDVGVLQEAVLPVVPPRVGALAVSVAHRPAGGPAAGGDFYDVVALDNDRTALVVGDVSGHGPGALGQATLVRFTLRAHLESGSTPREALAIAAESLSPHFDEGFATAAIALHDPKAGTLTYSTAAHEAPIVVGPGAHLPVLASSTPPLGIGGASARRQTTVPFPAKSLACMLTDGALEARVRGELVGRTRVEEWVRELGERPAAGDMAELIRSRAAVSDDLAVCFATSTAGEDSGDWRIEELYNPTPDEAERFLEACGADDEHKRSVAEALRFTRDGTLLRIRLENGAVVSVDVLRNSSLKSVAA